MSKRHSAKHKLDRRMGENIWGRPKSPVNKREYGPGQHGQRRKSKVSDYGIQLRAKDMHTIKDMANAAGPGQIVIIKINSNGGLVLETPEIQAALMGIRDGGHRLVAWIEKAISGGASRVFSGTMIAPSRARANKVMTVPG